MALTLEFLCENFELELYNVAYAYSQLLIIYKNGEINSIAKVIWKLIQKHKGKEAMEFFESIRKRGLIKKCQDNTTKLKIPDTRRFSEPQLACISNRLMKHKLDNIKDDQ